MLKLAATPCIGERCWLDSLRTMPIAGMRKAVVVIPLWNSAQLRKLGSNGVRSRITAPLVSLDQLVESKSTRCNELQRWLIGSDAIATYGSFPSRFKAGAVIGSINNRVRVPNVNSALPIGVARVRCACFWSVSWCRAIFDDHYATCLSRRSVVVTSTSISYQFQLVDARILHANRAMLRGLQQLLHLAKSQVFAKDHATERADMWQVVSMCRIRVTHRTQCGRHDCGRGCTLGI
jgi:hypothetical protein